MRYFETLFYAAGWSDDPTQLEGFAREVQRLARERGVRAEAVQPVAESDETAAFGPLAMLEALPAGAWDDGAADPAA